MAERKEEPMDLIERQKAIDAVKKNTFRLTFAEEQNCEGHVAWSAEAVYSDVMEGALLELPSAQPEKRTEERMETRACDLIDRQAAIDAIYHHLPSVSRTRARTMLHEVPSAQPEIIYCKDCKWKQGAECVRFADVRPFPSDFCSRAERREE